jgi:hypothetical protein
MRQVEDGGQRLSTEAAEKQFQKRFDISSGRRRLTCKSNVKVPEDTATSTRWEEWQGLTFGRHQYRCRAVVACRASTVHACNFSVSFYCT